MTEEQAKTPEEQLPDDLTEKQQQADSDQQENDPRGDAIEGGSSSAGSPSGPTAADVPPDAQSQAEATKGAGGEAEGQPGQESKG